MPHSVLAIANEFIRRALEARRRITPMHLQKLCYMSHGFELALFDKPLTKDVIEAWDYGPVYPDLYDALKRYGSGAVPELICENNWALLSHVRGNVVTASLTEDETDLIETVWKDYGDYEAFQLSALTHEQGTPWARYYVAGKKNIKIPDSAIKEYFIELTSQEA